MKVSLISISFFVLFAFSFISFVIGNTLLDIPFSFIIEACAKRNEDGRFDVSVPNIVVLQVPNICNIISLTVDLFLVRFLRKTIIPQLSNIGEDPYKIQARNNIKGCFHLWSISLTFYMRLFCSQVSRTAFLYSHFRFVVFQCKNIGAKAALRMLVKLTLNVVNNIF
jgi:hypothetical protein